MTNQTTPLQGGIAGEYFVAGELARRGIIASLTLRNTKGVDVLASSADGLRSASIQVKTCHGTNRRWVLNVKAETFVGDRLFYVFVALNDNAAPPTYHIVPSRIVADTLREQHALWLAASGKNGRVHVDNPMRNFHDASGEYLDRWDLLGFDEVPA